MLEVKISREEIEKNKPEGAEIIETISQLHCFYDSKKFCPYRGHISVERGEEGPAVCVYPQRKKMEKILGLKDECKRLCADQSQG